jgi:hypothetical protein
VARDEIVVSKLTSVVWERQEVGGVKMVVRGPRFAERKAEKREVIFDFRLANFTVLSRGEEERKGKREGVLEVRFGGDARTPRLGLGSSNSHPWVVQKT